MDKAKEYKSAYFISSYCFYTCHAGLNKLIDRGRLKEQGSIIYIDYRFIHVADHG